MSDIINSETLLGIVHCFKPTCINDQSAVLVIIAVVIIGCCNFSTVREISIS